MEQKVRIAILVSGGGTNLQAVIDAVSEGKLPNAEIAAVIASRADAFALIRAEKAGIPGKVVSPKDYPAEKEHTEALLSALAEAGADLVVLAGYMSILPEEIIQRYRRRILNIHPSLIPKYCGKGFYGHRVHQAVLAGGEIVSGATVHFVDEGVDTGEIILQEQVPVLPEDDADSLASRVLSVEHRILPEAIRLFCEGRI